MAICAKVLDGMQTRKTAAKLTEHQYALYALWQALNGVAYFCIFSAGFVQSNYIVHVVL